VKIDRTKKYAPILKSSIEQIETGNIRLFLMKDKAAVEQAIESGAERCTDETESIDIDSVVSVGAATSSDCISLDST